MEIKGLSGSVQRALQSLSRPCQYLFPGPDQSDTGSLSRSILLIGSELDHSVYDDPGFHRTYRLFEQTPDHHVEHFIHPETDYFRMTREHDVAPWALESRRSIFSFPLWICPLSWPGAWLSMQQLLKQLKRYDQFDETAPVILLITPDSFPFNERAAEDVDVTLTRTGLPSDPEALNTMTNHLLSKKTLPNLVDPDYSQHKTPEKQKFTPEVAAPLTALQPTSPDRCWIGHIESFDRNHSLQGSTWPTFSYPDPKLTLKVVEKVIDRIGVQCVELGPVSPSEDLQQRAWQLEFLERFQAKWGDRPICYQLDNPRPDHAVWAYDHLLKRYNHTPLQVHLGSPEEQALSRSSEDQIENWLTHFLSCGGPKMEFSVDFNGTAKSVSKIEQLCERIQSVNQQHIEGKGQLRVFLQPRLSDVSDWKPTDEWLRPTKQLQKKFETDLLQIKLDLPDQYKNLWQLNGV